MRKCLIPLVLLQAILLVGCAGLMPPQAHPAPPQSVAEPASPQAGEALVGAAYHVLVGEMAIQRRKPELAAQAYVNALEYSHDPALAKRATRIALYADQPEQAYRAARIWAQAKPESLAAQRIAARLALALGISHALNQYARRIVQLNDAGPGAGFRTLAHFFDGNPEHVERVLGVMDKLVGEYAGLAAAHYSYALLAMRYQAYETAARQIAKALALRPGWRKAVLLKVNVLVHQGRTKRARHAIAGLGDGKAERVRNWLTFARLLLDHGQYAEATRAFQRVLSLAPDNVDARYGFALVSLILHRPARATKALKTLYKAGKRADDAAYYLGRIAERQGDYARARRWYQRVDGGSNRIAAEIGAISMRARLGDVEGALEALHRLRQSKTIRTQSLIMAHGRILSRAGRLDAALALYNRALKRRPHSADLRYGRALTYIRMGRIQDAEADLRAIIDTQNNAARALNVLGYMLSNHTGRYREALGYIRRALQLRPHVPAIQDSMGWVLYQMGKLNKALDYLRKAYHNSLNPEVAAHLGEVLWKLGRKERAREIWHKALSHHAEARVLRDTMERLLP